MPTELFSTGVNRNRKNMTNPLSFLARWGNKDIVAIDLHGSSLKMALLRIVSSRAEVAKVLTRSVAGVSDEELSPLMRSCLKELNTKSPTIINVIPANLVITKNIEIPSNNPLEIKEIISLQAGRHTPYSREEILVDYLEVGTYRRN
jgi:Tfp pilus assembly PilM family ATPase